MTYILKHLLPGLLLLTLPLPCALQAAASRATYAVVVSKATREHAEWSNVVDALVKKHAAEVITYGADMADTLAALQELHPRYTCFVARPAEATRQFVADVHCV